MYAFDAELSPLTRSRSVYDAPPVKVRLVPTSRYAPAGHEPEAAGLIQNDDGSLAEPAPIVPVSPFTVMVKVPPMRGVPAETVTLVSLFAAALMVSSTAVKPPLFAQSRLEPGRSGRPCHTLTVCCWAVEVSAWAVR
ncbi:hypothetical protein AB0J80_25105 [Actinoplanes sp. NPDC049548]|uniref:hypothetical protein n=1 Tax=Actinoplanes sp. NPDC049548 TaxID=3155152 RepID=UPI00342C1D34